MANEKKRTGNTEINSFRLLRKMWFWLTPAGTCHASHERRLRNRACLRPHLEVELLETRVCPTLAGNNWMSFVPNATSLFQMSLPGTHDSMTGTVPFTTDDLLQAAATTINNAIPDALEDAWAVAWAASLGTLPGGPDLRAALTAVADVAIEALSLAAVPLVQVIAQTQSLNLQQQLDEGVRAVDIRVEPVGGDAFELVHQSLPIGTPPLMFDTAVLQVATDFLAQNPSETIVMQVQVDSSGSGNPDDIFHEYESEINPDTGQPYGNYIWQATSNEPVPNTLGEARGKIVIIQSNWNPADPTLPSSFKGQTPPPAGDIFSPIQNNFNTADLFNVKWPAAEQQFALAAQIPNQPGAATGTTTFAVNYLSANDPTGIFSTSPSYAYPEIMATGSGVYLQINLPTSIDGVIDDLTGQIITPEEVGAGHEQSGGGVHRF